MKTKRFYLYIICLSQQKSLVSMVTYIVDQYGQRAIGKSDKDISLPFFGMAESFAVVFKCSHCNSSLRIIRVRANCNVEQ